VLKSTTKSRKSKQPRFYNPKTTKQGILYIKHIPYGFEEKGILGFFSQFGQIDRVKLVRSKRSKRSRGFAFIQFELKEIAEVAAQAMDGYLLSERKLSCKVLDDNKSWRMKGAKRKFKYIPWKVIAKNRINKKKSEAGLRKVVRKLLENERKKRLKLKELGIEYEYRGFKEILDE